MAQNQVSLLLQRAARSGISSYAICHRADIHENTVRRWKKGEHDPSSEALERFTQALGELEAERKQ